MTSRTQEREKESQRERERERESERGGIQVERRCKKRLIRSCKLLYSLVASGLVAFAAFHVINIASLAAGENAHASIPLPIRKMITGAVYGYRDPDVSGVQPFKTTGGDRFAFRREQLDTALNIITRALRRLHLV